MAVTSGGAENTEPSLLAVTWREPLTFWGGTWHTAGEKEAARVVSVKTGGPETHCVHRYGTVCHASAATLRCRVLHQAVGVRTNSAGVHIRGGHDDGAHSVCKTNREATGASEPRAREGQRHAALTDTHRG